MVGRSAWPNLIQTPHMEFCYNLQPVIEILAYLFYRLRDLKIPIQRPPAQRLECCPWFPIFRCPDGFLHAGMPNIHSVWNQDCWNQCNRYLCNMQCRLWVSGVTLTIFLTPYWLCSSTHWSRCPVSRLQPICSQDGVTNFYSPCSAGCKSVETVSYIDQVVWQFLQQDFVWKLIFKNSFQEGKEESTKVYSDCSCLIDAWEANPLNISDESVKRDLLGSAKPVGIDVLNKARSVQYCIKSVNL